MKPHNILKVDDARKALEALLTFAEVDTCMHEETHREGIIWTACGMCGRRWSDDRNPFTGYEEPAQFEQAREAIRTLEGIV